MTDFEEWTDIEALVRDADRLPRLSQGLRHRVVTRAHRRHERAQVTRRLTLAAAVLFCIGQLTQWMQPGAETLTPSMKAQATPVSQDATEWAVVDSVVRSRIEQSRTMLSLF